jgi:16S rRNA (cytosine967-C5)-methyltransferase
MTSKPSQPKNAAAGAAVPNAPALWQQLDAVAKALHGILGGQSSKAVLAQVPQRLRPGVQALLFQVLRNLGRAQALQKQLAPRAPAPKVSALLSTALALAWDEAQAPYPPFTLVNQAVEAAKNGAARAQSGFINACLRRFLRERDALVSATDNDPVAVWNHPAWWIARLKKDHPQDWQAILAANNAQPPMTLRVNARKALQPSIRMRCRR